MTSPHSRTASRTRAAALILALLSGLPARAGDAPPPLSPQDRAELLQTLAAKLGRHYVFADVAARLQAALPATLAAYPPGLMAPEFAERLSRDLRTLADDRHFRVVVDPAFQEDADPPVPPDAQTLARQRAEAVQAGFGIEKIQRLPGNVGYVELRGFAPAEFVGAAYASVFALLEGTDALIVDLRRNGGGSPDSVALWMSHFFAFGDQRHLVDITTRSTGQLQQYWTAPTVIERYARPVYVLTSPRTFSGGEECAYDFQTQKRAVLVGQVTGGGANAGDRFSLGHGLVVNIPNALATNPVTHANWEHVGVKPDIEAPAAQAQQVAYAAILRDLAAQAADPDDAARLRHWQALAEKGESDAPVYEMRR